jgi:ligand-binding sensor domain-containing protein
MKTIRIFAILLITTLSLLAGDASFSESTWTVLPLQLVDDRVVKIIFREDGSTWYISKKGVVRYHEGTITDRYYLGGDIEGIDIMSAAFDHDNRLWVCAFDGLSMFDGVSWTRYTKDAQPILNRATDVAVDDDNVVWCTTLGGLIRIEGDEWTVFNRDNTTLTESRFECIDIAPDGVMWLGTGDGVVRYDVDTWTHHRTLNRGWMDIVYGVRDIAVDQRGNVWVATDEGVSVYDGSRWRSFFETEGQLKSDNTSSIAVAPNGDIWVGTYHGGVSRYDGESWTTFTTEIGLSDNSVISVACKSDGTVYAGTFGKGVCTYHPDVSAVKHEAATTPKSLILTNSYPNPFNLSTTIRFTLPREGRAVLNVYNALGVKITTLADGLFPAGVKMVTWDAAGKANGIYFYSIEYVGTVSTRKMLLLK